MIFPEETGYKETARMLVECGLAFIFNGDKIH